ncbi:hypothetical protein HZC27_04400 [Candidatus Roizmanbacteria bacterium]|nr:hypothetical protein [Candidatus Roizmanbacteria bacterium]
MEKLDFKQQIYEILRSPVSPHDADAIISCCKYAWPDKDNNGCIYPYLALRKPQSWMPEGELGLAIARGDMYSSVVRDENGEIVAHAALVRNKLGLWERGRVFTNQPGKGYGELAMDGALKQAIQIGAEYVYTGRSYNRTSVAGAARRVAEANGMQIAVIGVSPHLYQEQGSGGEQYDWGEVDSIIMQKGKKLSISLPNNAPYAVKRLAEIIAGKNPGIELNINHRLVDNAAECIKIDEHIGLIDINDVSQQEALIKAGCIPVGIMPVQGSWFVKFFKGEAPPVIHARMDVIKPGISPVYCSDDREYQIINSILNNDTKLPV